MNASPTNYSLPVADTYVTHYRSFAFKYDFLDSNGKMKIKIVTNAPASQYTFSIDSLRIMRTIINSVPMSSFAEYQPDLGTCNLNYKLDYFDSLYNGTTGICNIVAGTG